MTDFDGQFDESQGDSFLNNPDRYLAPLSTTYIAEAYHDAFEEVKVREKLYYIEKPNEKVKGRIYRYIASYTANGQLLPVQNLARLSGKDIWGKAFTEEDLNEVAKAITLIKVRVDGDNPDAQFDRGIQLSDQTEVNVQYVPYTSENTSTIVNDLDQDIAE
jgi:hypothetical protein